MQFYYNTEVGPLPPVGQEANSDPDPAIIAWLARLLGRRQPPTPTVLPTVYARGLDRPPNPDRALNQIRPSTARFDTQVDTALNRRLYEAVYPHEYSREVTAGGSELDKLSRAIRAIRGEEVEPRPRTDPRREDAWLTYLQLPQESDTFRPSRFRPTRARDPQAKYLSFELGDFFEGVGAGSGLSPSGLVRRVVSTLDENGKDNFQDEDNYTEVMGVFSWSKGQDSRGPYIAYYDRWDLDQNPVEGREGRFGRPFEIYDRIYYDPQTFEPIDLQRRR